MESVEANTERRRSLPVETIMIIISGKVYVDADVRDDWVAQHQEMVARARERPGCLDLVIAADPLENDRYNVYEAWESEEHVAEWREIANPPESRFDPDRVEVQKHHVSESGPPF